MRRSIIIFTALFLLTWNISWINSDIKASSPPLSYALDSIYFEPLSDIHDANFVSQTSGYDLYLNQTGADVLFTVNSDEQPEITENIALNLTFLGANPDSTMTGEDTLAGISNYYIGDEENWRTQVPHYGKIRYESLYTGIDAIFYGNPDLLQFDFEIAPHIDPSQIQLEFNYDGDLQLDESGNLLFDISGENTFQVQAPYTHQLINGQQVEIPSQFVIEGNKVRFALGNYDPALPLVIDPTLVYSGLIGGSSADQGFAIAVDDNNNAYVTGWTRGNYNTTDGTTSRGGRDVIISKVAPDGTLLYSTQIGGSDEDFGFGIDVDSSGSAYVTGTTQSSNYPRTAGAVGASITFPGSRSFITKLDNLGAIVYSGEVAAAGEGEEIVVDALGRAYVTGSTSNGLGTSPSLAYNGGIDGFYARINAAGTDYDFAGYIGGSGNDAGLSIALDSSGRIYIGGETSSADLPATGPDTTLGGSRDGFIMRLNASGTAIDYATYIGGTGDDTVRGIAVDANDNAYVTGVLRGTGGFTVINGPAVSSSTDFEMLVARLNATGTAFDYAGYVGGNGDDHGEDIAVTPTGIATAFGWSWSSNYVEVDPLTDADGGGDEGNQDPIITTLLPDGTIDFSSYLSGNRRVLGFGIDLDSAGNLFLTGYVQRIDSGDPFPLVNGPSLTHNGGNADVFVTNITTAVPNIAFQSLADSATEGNTSAGTIALTVPSGSYTGAYSVDVTYSGTASNGSDYTRSNTVTFNCAPCDATGSPYTQNAVTIIEDTLLEADETIVMTLSNLQISGDSGIELGATDNQTLTITDDESATLNFTSATDTVAENQSPQVSTVALTINVNGGTGGTGTIATGISVSADILQGNITTDITDFAGALSPSAFNFTDGNTTGDTVDITVPINNDGVAEGDETFSLNLTNLTSSATANLGTATQTITITDPPNVVLTVADINVSEGDVGTQAVTVTVTANTALGASYTVNYATSTNSATAGTDYTETSGTLTFSGNTANETQTFTVNITGDTNLESDETFNISLSNPSSTFVNATDTAVATILDDETATVTISATDNSAAENPSDNGLFMITLSRNNDTGSPITVNLTVGGSATPNSDYATLGSSISIPDGSNSATVIVDTTGRDDSLSEGNETVQITLDSTNNSAVTVGSPASATVIITDDDVPTVTIADVAIAEGDSGTQILTFTATLNLATTGFDVTYATSDNTAISPDDYNATTGTLTFVGNAGETQLFGVTINSDTIVELDNTFNIALGTATNPAVDTSDTATGTITNDDTATVILTDETLTEGNAGTQTVILTATLSNAVEGGLTVNYTTNDVTASAGTDYTATSGTLTFAGATADETQQISVSINGDTTLEGNETLNVELSSPSNTNVTANDIGSITITDDDTASLSITDVAITESDSGTQTLTVTVALNNAVQGGFSVGYATSAISATNGDDYTNASGTLTFNGIANETQTFTVTINGDTTTEPDETFAISLGTATNPAVNSSDTATATITNDDTTAVIIDDIAVSEGDNGTQTLTFTATLTNAVQGAFTVNFTTADNTAMAGSDYTATSGTLSFAGNANETQSIAVVVNGDTNVEGNETFTISMNTVSNPLVDITDTGTGTINNDDASAITIEDVSVSEGDTGTQNLTFTLTLSNAAVGSFTVDYATSDNTALAGSDYVASSGQLTFIGNANETQTVSVPINGDTIVEPDETFLLSLSNSSNGGVSITDTATGTVTNDDSANITVTDATLAEPASGTAPMTFTATLDNAVQGGFTVRFFTTEDTAQYGDDLTRTEVFISFAGTAGEVQTIDVPILSSTAFEPEEFFTFRNDSISVADVTANNAIGIITETPAGTLTIGDESITEGNTGTQTLTFTVTLDSAIAGGFTVDYATSNDSAFSGSDYIASTGTLTFAGNANETQTIDVIINGDTNFEGDEVFTVGLSNPSNTRLDARDTATGTILTDDTTVSTGNIYTVTATGDDITDDAVCTLREAITELNGLAVEDACLTGTAAGLSRIEFNIPVSGVQTINIATALPTIVTPSIINGESQPNATCQTNMLIEVVGPGDNNIISGFVYRTSASGSTLRGLVINSFVQAQVSLDAVDNMTIECNFIGTDTAGTTSVPGTRVGISIVNGSDNNIIGTNGDGTDDALERNVIGGTTRGGQGFQGDAIRIITSDNNHISGNYIGLGADGVSIIRNSTGIRVTDRANNNIIGTNGDGIADEAERNIIGGINITADEGHGILLNNEANNTIIAGNYIGVRPDGITPIADLTSNTPVGIEIFNRTSNTIIGTNGDGVADEDERNIFGGMGASINILSAIDTTIAGNYFGIGADGITPIGGIRRPINLRPQIDPLAAPILRTIIGTNGDGIADEAERNVIGISTSNSITILGAGTTFTRVAGNYIGVAADGVTPMTNGGSAFQIDQNATDTIIGTNGDGIADDIEGNVIVGSRLSGIYVDGNTSDASGRPVRVQIAGNLIGLAADGTTIIPNGTRNPQAGIVILGGAQDVIIGTNGDGVSDIFERNIISGNGHDGIYILNDNTNDIVVAGNYIGTDITGASDRGNNEAGIVVFGAYNVRIGTNGDGTQDEAEGNLIAGNDEHGIVITGSSGNDVTVAGNIIGTDSTGETALPNALNGIWVRDSATNIVIGGDTMAEGNIIGSNGEQGILSEDISNLTIQNNAIGIGANSATIPNAQNGILARNSLDLLIADNNIYNHPVNGILLENGTALISVELSSRNCIVDNTFGFDNQTGTEVLFENNWWGAANGPSGVGSGNGDAVSSEIDFTPWLTVASDDCSTRADIISTPPTQDDNPVIIPSTNQDADITSTPPTQDDNPVIIPSTNQDADILLRGINVTTPYIPRIPITWVFTIENLGVTSANNLMATVTYSCEVEQVLQAESNSGIAGTSQANSVTFNLGNISAGETVTLTIEMLPPEDVTTCSATLTLTIDGVPLNQSATLSTTAIEMLPSTGQAPWWRNWLFIGIGFLLVMTATYSIRQSRF